MAGLSCIEIDLDDPPAVAVSCTVWAVGTDSAFAVKDALVAAAGIVTEAGTLTFVLLLASATVMPFFGAEPDKVTLQGSASDPTIDELLQETALRVGALAVPLPVRLTD